jgi:NitT/TauT family transport system permease protein
MNWELLLPNGQVLWNHIVNNWYYFAQNWWDTFSVSFMACTLAASFGFILALVSLRWPLIDIFIGPIIAISQSFPLQALAPIIVIIAGSGTFTRILVAFIITFFPIYGSLSNALREIPDNVTAFLKVCRAPFLESVILVKAPYALPRIISGLKVGFTLSVVGTVVAEFIAPQAGLGKVLLIAQSTYDIEVIYICISLLIIQGLIIYISLSAFEKQALRNRNLAVST